MLFFACGASWSSLSADFTVGKLSQCAGPRVSVWIPLIIYAVMISALLVIVEFAPNVWLTRVLCLLVGASLFTNFIRSLQTSLMWLNDKQEREMAAPLNDQSYRVTLGTMLVGLALLFSAFFNWLADRMYYTNRNITYWVRICIGSTVLLGLVSAIIQSCLIRRIMKESAGKSSNNSQEEQED